MVVVLQSITPKRHFLIDEKKFKSQLKANMEAYTESVKTQLQIYPPPSQRPTRQRLTSAERTRLEQAAARRGEEFRAPGRWRPYKRTQRLMRGWKKVVTPDGSQGFVFNDTRYAVYVQGPHGGGRGKGQRQTRLNRSRGWRSISDVARETRKEFTTVMNRAVKGGISLK